jgi:hypothetical protein
LQNNIIEYSIVGAIAILVVKESFAFMRVPQYNKLIERLIKSIDKFTDKVELAIDEIKCLGNDIKNLVDKDKYNVQ